MKETLLQYRDKRVVITGGLGFLGSNLAWALLESGAHLTLIDNLTPGCGGSLRNFESGLPGAEIVLAGIGDRASLRDVLPGTDVIFNLAGEISHIHSMLYPERDLEINATSQLRFLELCSEFCRGVRVVYAGTRQVYGAPRYLPVDEYHPIQPVDYNGVHKNAAAEYHFLLGRLGRIRSIVLRFTNIYGPRMALNIPCQGVLSVFVQRALCGKPIKLYGGGHQVRDPLYVGDAVEALLRAGVSKTGAAMINIGYGEPVSLCELAERLAATTGGPKPEAVEFPAARKEIDIGDFTTNIQLAARELGWKPRTSIADGLARTLAFYESNPPDPLQECTLGHLTRQAAAGV